MFQVVISQNLLGHRILIWKIDQDSWNKKTKGLFSAKRSDCSSGTQIRGANSPQFESLQGAKIWPMFLGRSALFRSCGSLFHHFCGVLAKEYTEIGRLNMVEHVLWALPSGTIRSSCRCNCTVSTCISK